MRGIFLRAIESQYPVDIIYLSKKGIITQRTVKVVEITNEHIKAYCFLRRDYRVFSLSNVLSVYPKTKQYRGA